MRSTIIKFMHRLGSLKLTLVLMLGLVVTTLATYKNPDLSVSWVALPLAFLAINLLAAIMTNKRFRKQGGLLLFHLGLLAIIILAAVGIMTAFDARLEITEGQMFDPADVEIVHQGHWHNNHLDRIIFTQGPVHVDFVSSQRRSDTRSKIWLMDETSQHRTKIIGDKQVLDIAGYRFISTGNKGYSIILTWFGDNGFTTTGAINMPSYPMYEWKQDNEWITSEGQKILLSLDIVQPDRQSPESAWTLNSQNINARLQIKTTERNQLLQSGDNIRLEHGVLQFEDIRVWMGYRIDYSPILVWQFIAALIAIFGLAFHFRQKFSTSPIDQKTSQRGQLEQSVHA